MPNLRAPSASAPTLPQTYFVQTFGCQMNVADTERMEALLSEQGLTRAPNLSQAGVIIVNGCSVREKAVQKALSSLGRLQFLKDPADRTKPGPIIGVGGCVAQLDRANLFKRAPYIDFVFGTDAIDSLPEIVHRVRNGERHVLYTEFDKSQDYSTETKILGNQAQAFVNIMKGCDKYCTYCIVPFTRGREKSRTIDEVLEDLSRLVARGVREVTLLGQNVNSFGKGNANTHAREPQELHNVIGKVGPKVGEENFPQLLRAIDGDPRLESLKIVRFTSSHPLDFSNELIECYNSPENGGVAKLAPHLHLPVQSGSDRILQKMGRHHQIEGYIAQMDRLKQINPHVGLSTDLIVGFPGETDEDFQATLRLLDRVQYDNIYAFAYSPRPGTRAAKLQDDVPTKIKSERLNTLLAHQYKIAEKRFAMHIGREVDLLVEGPSKNDNLIRHRSEKSWGPSHHSGRPSFVWTGRAASNHVVNFITESPRPLTGQILRVKIHAASSLALQGEWAPG